MITYAFSDKKELGNITLLLKESNLPYGDIEECDVHFIIAKENERIVGCIGLEKYDTEGLLRSFAVDRHYQGKGYGYELYNRLLFYAVQNGIQTLHLLTTTAANYFIKTGFRKANRSNAPEVIQNSKEFKSICPSSSHYMVLEDISTYVINHDE
jgi:amino-acid N-acetyltransferase